MRFVGITQSKNFDIEAESQKILHMPLQLFGQYRARQADKASRALGYAAGEFPGSFKQKVRRNDFSYQTQFVGSAGVQCLACQKKVSAAVHSQEQRKYDMHPIAGDLSSGEMCRILKTDGRRCQHDIREQRQFAVAPCGAVDRTNHWNIGACRAGVLRHSAA